MYLVFTRLPGEPSYRRRLRSLLLCLRDVFRALVTQGTQILHRRAVLRSVSDYNFFMLLSSTIPASNVLIPGLKKSIKFQKETNINNIVNNNNNKNT